MTLKNVNYTKVENLTEEQKEKLEIPRETKKGIVAIETHNPDYKQKGIIIKRGISSYILNGN